MKGHSSRSATASFDSARGFGGPGTSPRLARARGFSLLELSIALLVAALLATICYPVYSTHVRRARRMDAIAVLLELQLAQERWRSEHLSYASFDELGASSSLPGGHYVLDMPAFAPDAYILRALAVGGQAADHECGELRLSVELGRDTPMSSPSGGPDNDEAANRRCWNL